MKTYDVNAMPVTLDIGLTGSNRQREFAFDVRAWAQDYPGAVFAVCCRRPGEGPDSAYFGDTRMEDGILIWTVHRADLGTAAGNGRIEVWAVDQSLTFNDEPLFKSRAVTTIVTQSIAETPSQTLPEAAKPWAQQVLDAAVEASEAADRAEGAVEHYPQVGENGNWFVWDAVTEEWVDTGATAHGEQGPQGEQGAQGPQGVPGQDAVVDATLTHSGEAADAKATGDAIDALDGGKVDKADYSPVAKTAAMTQAVGKDASGGLWTAPGGGGGGASAEPHNFAFDGANLLDVFADADALWAALAQEDYTHIHLGDYYPVTLNGSYRDYGSMTCQTGQEYYTDTDCTNEAGTAAQDYTANPVLDATLPDSHKSYCEVTISGTKYYCKYNV